MLNMNKKISRNLSHADTMWLKRPELNAEEVLNQKISRKREVLIEVTCD